MAYISLVNKLFTTGPSLLEEILMEGDTATDFVDSQSSLMQEMNDCSKQAHLREEKCDSTNNV
jgi:hypothetical protein